MKYFYNLIRPLINKTEIQNKKSVANRDFIERAINLEKGKYRVNWIMQFYYNSIDKIICLATSKKNIDNIIDIGCATGVVIQKLAKERKDISFIGIDIMDEAINEAERNNMLPNLSFKLRDFIHDEIKETYDLITCLQTLEHIEDKDLKYFIENVFAHSRKAVICSVPREPFWCIANILRFKYWSRLGNTPHHIQHWSKNSFENTISEFAKKKWGRNTKIYSYSPLNLWTIILAINNNE